MIGIIVAMQVEADAILEYLNDYQTIEDKGLTFYTGEIHNKSVVMVLSGIGKVGATFATTLLIERYKPSLIINTGISGGLGVSELFDIVIADKVVQHDFDITMFGHPIGYVPGIQTVFLETNKDINNYLLEALPKAKLGTLASGDQFISDDKKAKAIVSNYNAIACDMESGAIAMVAKLSGIDIAIVRVISDNGDDNANIDFNNFAKKASIINSQAVANTIYRLN